MPFWTSKVKDPVCGMDIDKKKALASLIHGGITYFFCSLRCNEDFQKNPDRYTGRPAPTQHQEAHH